MNRLCALLIITFVATSCATNKYIAFRLDDIQDYWITDAQEAVINVFKNAQLPMTIGIIANSFGDDDEIVDYVKTCLEDSNFPVEIANHGWNHEDFSTFTENEQATMLSESKTKTVGQLSPLISDITTFIPPFDGFNDDTITAMTSAGYNAISSDISFYGYGDAGDCEGCEDARPYPGTNTHVKEYPAGSGTNDLYDMNVISVAESVDMIETQMARDGFSVVMMHFNWYSVEANDGTTSVNQDMINQLNDLVSQCQSLGYTFTTIGQLAQDLNGGGSSSTSTSSSSTTHAVKTTGKSTPATTGHSTPVTTGKSTPVTTAQASPVTTQSSPVSMTTHAAATKLTTHAVAAPLTTGAASGACTTGSMKCLTSETFSTCDHSAWGPSQPCQTGETCHPSGQYIYCY